MGLSWDGKTGGWKRGLPGPVENGRRGLAEVLLGIRGVAVAPGKMEEMGFTRPEVLGGRKEKASQRPSRAVGPTLTKCPPASPSPARAGSYLPPSFQIPVSGQTKRTSPTPILSPTTVSHSLRFGFF